MITFVPYGMDSFSVHGLEDASTFPSLFRELARRGWGSEDLGKLAGGNFLRVLGAAERAAVEGRRRHR
jgi:membrane dipeptidase